jgi:hypothetical protein
MRIGFIGTGNMKRASGLGWRVKHILHFDHARSPTTRSLRRSLAVGAFVCALAISVLAQVDPGPPTPLVPIKPPQSSQQDVPGWIRRGLPGSGHEALQPLVGSWRVRYEVYGTLGRRGDEPPIVSEDITTRREWIGEGRFIEDTTEGTLMGAPFWRRGWLGYSNIDQRYEWVTIDSVNPTMMIYLGAPRSGPQQPIDMNGAFTDLGVAGEDTVGKRVGLRTVIRIDRDDRHVFELYFKRPGGKEVLALRSVYVRVSQ